MSGDEAHFFHLRKAAKTYISKVFKWGASSEERLRNVRMVMEGSDVLHLGEIEGALCLQLTGEKRKIGYGAGERSAASQRPPSGLERSS